MTSLHTSSPPSRTEGAQLVLYILSDSSGQTALHLARAVLSQFPDAPVRVERFPRVRTVGEITAHLHGLDPSTTLIAYTLVLPEFRDVLITEARTRGFATVDLLEPLLSQVATLSGCKPREEVGRLHLLDESYFKRMDAVNFAVNHDDGGGLDTLGEADVVLIGLSRSSKTPTCLYLAQHFGLNAANVPIVPGIPAPSALHEIPRERLIGLRVEPRVLHTLRAARARMIGFGRPTDYTEHAAIEDEVREASTLFQSLGCRIIDVSRRAVEETASEIALLLARP